MPYETKLLTQKIQKAVHEENWALALDLVYQSKINSPSDPNLLNQEALIHLKMNELSLAEKRLQEAIKNGPDLAISHNHLGLVYFKKNDFQAAKREFLEALKKQPDYFSALYNLGLCHEKMDEPEEALACALALIEANPQYQLAYFMIARLLIKKNLAHEAVLYLDKMIKINENQEILEKTFAFLVQHHQEKLGQVYIEKLISLEPNNAQHHYHLALIFEQKKELHDATQAYKKALSIKPDYFAALNNLGVLALANKEPEEAIHYFQKALDLSPNNESIQYTLKALRGDKNTVTAPAHYISQLFDAYADHFDTHLTQGLMYRVPELLHELCQPYLKNEKTLLLDLGCGTGLSATPFMTPNTIAIGVDLSEKMLAQAQKKEIFHELHQSDIIHFLQESQQSFDIILAADVLVYFGDLSLLFKLIKSRLAKEGLFTFSLENNDKMSFSLTLSGRFSHSPLYIDELAKIHQLSVLKKETVVTRLQFEKPVWGDLYLLKNG